MTGILIGVLGTSLLGPVHAQTAGQSRWKEISSEHTQAGWLTYVKDVKGNTCWLAIGVANGGGIAPAPLNACQ